MDFWTPIGVIITVLIALRFISQLGKSLPILELMLLNCRSPVDYGPFNRVQPPKSTLQIFYVRRPTAIHELCGTCFWGFCNSGVSGSWLYQNYFYRDRKIKKVQRLWPYATACGYLF